MTGKVTGDKGPHYGSFRGRAGRNEWWTHIIVCTLTAPALVRAGPYGPFLILPLIYVVLAVSSRRLHDFKLSVWMYCVPLFFWAVFFCMFGLWGGAEIESGKRAADHFSSTQNNVLTALALASALATFVLMACIALVPGTRGPNRYGEADMPALKPKRPVQPGWRR